MEQMSECGFPTELRARGYSVLPAPRRVDLTGGCARLDGRWRLEADGLGEDIAARTLAAALRDEHALRLAGRAKAAKTLRLSVRPGAVETGAEPERDEQAYRLDIAAGGIEIVANGRPGLLYGAQTLLQLLEGPGLATLSPPIGTIVDWPEYRLRFVHWDTKHHQDRMETLRRLLDWMARLKLNAVSFELEDKFEYPSHPVIGCPGAFTTAQLQELVDYGLERHIQIVPNVQAPAHMCYVLKHEPFAHLRCDGSNYQSCMDDPEVRRLIFDMYDDLCRATRGVKYFHVSTDEIYYAGICEKYRKPYNPANRSLTWVDYVQAARDHLADRGRQVIVWAEFPLLAEHVRLLPADLINGILGPRVSEEFVRAVDERGIGQLAYCPMQGEERLVPNYFAYTARDGKRQPGRLTDAWEVTRCAHPHARKPIGTFAAAWDDSGLHNETFWLGWATMAQGGWAGGGPAVEETVATFMDVYYGRGVTDMIEVYRDMQDAARFWEGAWDRTASTVRGPAYGNHAEKRPVTRHDMTLGGPALPKLPDLAVEPIYRARYARLLADAVQRLAQSDRLIARLQANLARAARNQHNLEVFLSLAGLIRHLVESLPAIAEIEDTLEEAHGAHRAKDPRKALRLLARARDGAAHILAAMDETHRNLIRVWEKSRHARNAPVAGRQFLHVMDDVKDHFADRRADLSYHTAPFESIGLDKYRDALGEVIGAYAEANGLPAPD